MGGMALPPPPLRLPRETLPIAPLPMGTGGALGGAMGGGAAAAAAAAAAVEEEAAGAADEDEEEDESVYDFERSAREAMAEELADQLVSQVGGGR